MLSLISTLGGLLASGLPSLLNFFQDRADKKQELELARMQTEREMQLAREGFIAQQKVEEIRTDQIAMQSEAQMQNAALDHDKKIMEKASQWVVNLNGIVRPSVTFIFVIELVLINFALTYWFMQSGTITNVDEMIKASDVIFSESELSMLGGIIGYWFGSRGWGKK
jgi:hypothetical protein